MDEAGPSTAVQVICNVAKNARVQENVLNNFGICKIIMGSRCVFFHRCWV